MKKGLVFVITITMSAIASLSSYSAFGESTQPVHLTFIGNNQYSPTHVNWAKANGAVVTVVNLDDQQNLEKQLALGLPFGDLTNAIAIARARIRSIPKERWTNLFVGPMDAKKWGIKKYPAIVFNNGDSVIYGVLDLKFALMKWEASRNLNN